MNNFRHILLVGIVFLLFTEMAGQTFQSRWVGLEQGLSQSSVSAIVQDDSGFVWMATQDGLNRFDGYGFSVVKKEPFDSASLTANRISALLTDQNGLIWVGTAFSGLNVMNPVTRKIRRITRSRYDPTSLSSNAITSLFEDSKGHIWVGTSNGLNQLVLRGLNPMRDSLSFIRYQVDERDQTWEKGYSYMHAMVERENGEIWVGSSGTPNGLQLFEYLSNGVLVPKTMPGSLHKEFIRAMALAEDKLGRMWIGTPSGLLIWDAEKDRLINEPGATNITEEISCLLSKENGDMWIGTSRGAYLLVFDPETLQFAQEAIHFEAGSGNSGQLSGNEVMSIHPDALNPDGVWLGTYTGGATYLSKNNQPFRTNTLRHPEVSQLSSASLTAILKDQNGVLWLGTHKGLVRYDPVRDSYTILQDENRKGSKGWGNVLCLWEDRKGRKWMGTYEGLFQIVENESGTVGVHSYPVCKGQSVFCLYETEEGMIAIGGHFGVSIFDPETSTFVYCGTSLDKASSEQMGYRVRSIFQDSRRQLWVGTSHGLIRFRESGVMETVLRDSELDIFCHKPIDSSSLRNDLISGIVEDAQGNIWVGTMDGLVRMNNSAQNGGFETFTEHQGLSNNMIYGILTNEAKDEIWISTNGGLTRIGMDSQKIDNFHIQDGLQSNEFNDRAFHRASDGEILFGGINGYSRFYPEAIQYDKVPPRVLISRYTDCENVSHDLTYDLPEQIEIPWAGNSFSVGFSGLEFAHTDKVTYAYQMEGLNADWIACGEARTAYFNNLASGTYTFRVRAANGDGVWSDGKAAMVFVVHPPFWQRAWFYLLALLAVGGLLWLGHYYRVQTKVRRVMELERVRKNTAADFHDELGHKLTIISLFGEILKKQLNGSADTAAPHLDKIIATSNSLYYSMKDLLWVLDPEKDSVLDLVLLLKDFGDELFDKTGVAFRTEGISDALAEPILPMNYKRHIVLIFKEVMNNALKHANCQNAVLKIDFAPGRLYVCFSDDGEGFEIETGRIGHGINNLYDRADKICGDLKISSGETGTRIALTCLGVGEKGKLISR